MSNRNLPPPSGIRLRTAPQAIVFAWLVAGILDLAAAIVLSGLGTAGVLKFIASGVFGQQAFNGDWQMAAWGLLFHFFIAFAWTLLFFWLYPRLPVLSRYKVPGGLAYGIVIWLVMNLLVLPLAKAPVPPFDLMRAVRGAAVLMLAIGLPLALITGRFYDRKRS